MKYFSITLIMAVALMFAICVISLSPAAGADQGAATQDVSSKLQGDDRELYQQVVTALDKDPIYNHLDYTDDQFKYVVTKCDRLVDLIKIKDPSSGGFTVGRPHFQLMADIYSLEQYRGNLIDELTTSSAVGSKLSQVFDILKTAYEAVEDASWWGVASTLYGTYSAAQNENILKPDELTNRAFNAIYEAYSEQRGANKNHDQAFAEVNGPWISATNTASMEAAKRYYKSLSRMVNLKWEDPALSLAVSKYLEERYKVDNNEPLQPYEVDPRNLQGVTTFEPKFAMENLLRAIWHDTKVQLKKDLKSETDLCQKSEEQIGNGAGTNQQSQNGELTLDHITVTAYKDYVVNIASPDEKTTHGRVVLAEPKQASLSQRHFEFDSEVSVGSKYLKSTALMDIELPDKVPIVNNEFKFKVKAKSSGKFSSHGYDEKSEQKTASIDLINSFYGLSGIGLRTLEHKRTKEGEDINNRDASLETDIKEIPFGTNDLSRDGQIAIPLAVSAGWGGILMGSDHNGVFIDVEVVYKRSSGASSSQPTIQVKPEEVVQIIPRTDELRKAYPGLDFECQPTSLTTSVNVLSLPKKIPEDKAIFLRSSSEFKGKSISGLKDGYMVYIPRGGSQSSWLVHVTSGDSVMARLKSSELKPTIYLVPCLKGGLSGQGWFEVMKQLQGFSVETSNLVATPKKTKFFVDATNDTSTKVAVYEGQVEVVPKNTSLSPVTVNSGQEVAVGPDSISQVESAEPVPDWTEAPVEGSNLTGNATTVPTGASGNATVPGETSANSTTPGSVATGVPGSSNATPGNATSGAIAPGSATPPSVFGPGAFAGGASAPANNNQIGDAAEVGIGQSIIQSINPAGSSNFYRFHADSPGILKLRLENAPAEMKPEMSLYDKNFAYVVSKSAANPGDSLTLEKDLSGPAWYYIEVKDGNGKAHSEPYSLKITFKAASDRYEPNPNFLRAVEVQAGEGIEGYICPINDEDFYRIYAATSGILKLKLDTVPADMKSELTLYDKGFGYITSSAAANPGDSLSLDKDLQGPGWFFIKVRDADGKAHSEPYSLAVSIKPAPDQNEPNPNFFRASEIATSQGVSAYICPVNDEDFYKFYVNGQEIVNIRLDGVPAEMKGELTLYDKGFGYMTSSTAANPGDKVKLEKDVKGPGWFFIKVRDGNGKAHSEPYSMTIGSGAGA